MALLPSNPGGVERKRHAKAFSAFVLTGDVNSADRYAITDVSVESGAGVPTHTLPGRIGTGLFLRTDGSLVATLYLTVNAGGTWTAMTVP